MLPVRHADQGLHASLSEGRWTHDFPIDCELARDLGLPVSTDLPDEVRRLMSPYPQPRGRRPSVEYIPTRYEAPQPRPHPGRRTERRGAGRRPGRVGS